MTMLRWLFGDGQMMWNSVYTRDRLSDVADDEGNPVIKT
jgi:hypothetical protein